MAFRTGSVLFPSDSTEESALYRAEVRDVSIRNDVSVEREAIRRKRRDLSDDNLNVETAFAVAKRVILRLEERSEGKWLDVPKQRWEAIFNEYEKLSEVVMDKSLALRDEKNSAQQKSLSD